MNELVSIITPCYNGAKYLPLFLESVLSQTYRPIELIFVDDGSTDNTKEVFESYRDKLITSGVTPIYIYQKNAGQAAAINAGLPIFKGDYLMWMDSDDIILPDNISKKIDFLEKNPDKGFVLCEGLIVNASDVNTPLGTLSRRLDGSLNNMELFRDLIMEHNVIYVPATIMARRQAVLSAIPSLHIYEGRQGQNWQLMLPLAYCCEYGLIQEPLFKYVIHDDSHSHSRRTYEEEIQRAEQFEELICTTIGKIPALKCDELERWTRIVKIKYIRIKFRTACIKNRRANAIKFYRQLKQMGDNRLTDHYAVFKMKLILSNAKKRIKIFFK